MREEIIGMPLGHIFNHTYHIENFTILRKLCSEIPKFSFY